MMCIRLEMTFVVLLDLCLAFALFFRLSRTVPISRYLSSYCGVSVLIIVLFTTIFLTDFPQINIFGLLFDVEIAHSVHSHTHTIPDKKRTQILSKCFILHRIDKIANITSSLPPSSSSSSHCCFDDCVSVLQFAIYTSVIQHETSDQPSHISIQIVATITRQFLLWSLFASLSRPSLVPPLCMSVTACVCT